MTSKQTVNNKKSSSACEPTHRHTVDRQKAPNMNRDRRRFEPPAGLTGAPVLPQKPSRLSRSFRRTQLTQTAAEVEPAQSQQSDFKTPTRVQRSKTASGFSAESPHNDSDLQQDIIWDATSPSPNRLGKRGKKQRAGVVDISEIVSRIAPKHGRPKVTEPTLEQWIGDSADIPCTPDVQVPKPKKKSQRPNGVDDLLKLAKQFDFNMFRQDEEGVEDLQQHSPELLSEDVLDFEGSGHNVFSPSLPGNCSPAVTAAAGGNDVHPDQQMDDDLDFLFDGATQHVSGNLSQVTSQVKPASAASCREASGKPALSSQVPTTNTKCTLRNNAFEDDWENDDLLNDSLVLEMTQNPQNFSAPQLCSTQKPSSQTTNQRRGLVSVPVSRHVGLGQSAAAEVEKDNVRQRASFKLEPNPDFSVRKVQTDTRTDLKVDYRSGATGKDSQQRFSVKQGPQRTWNQNPERSEPQEPQFDPRTSVTNHVTTAARKPPPTVPELLDEDLSSFFLSDPIWDDPTDDDLLCEMCDDMEKQIQTVENVSTKQTLPVGRVSDQRAALQPTTRTWDHRNKPANQQPVPPKQTNSLCASDGPAAGSWAAGFVCRVPAGAQKTDSFRLTQTEHTSGRTNGSSCVRASSGARSAPPPGNARKDQFTFKKPSSLVCAAPSKVVGKCSAAEIELKKQQAMARRRQRLQHAQNLRAPT